MELVTLPLAIQAEIILQLIAKDWTTRVFKTGDKVRITYPKGETLEVFLGRDVGATPGEFFEHANLTHTIGVMGDSGYEVQLLKPDFPTKPGTIVKGVDGDGDTFIAVLIQGGELWGAYLEKGVIDFGWHGLTYTKSDSEMFRSWEIVENPD